MLRNYQNYFKLKKKCDIVYGETIPQKTSLQQCQICRVLTQKRVRFNFKADTFNLNGCSSDLFLPISCGRKVRPIHPEFVETLQRSVLPLYHNLVKRIRISFWVENPLRGHSMNGKRGFRFVFSSFFLFLFCIFSEQNDLTGLAPLMPPLQFSFSMSCFKHTHTHTQIHNTLTELQIYSFSLAHSYTLIHTHSHTHTHTHTPKFTYAVVFTSIEIQKKYSFFLVLPPSF